jgi:hypothetical protein
MLTSHAKVFAKVITTLGLGYDGRTSLDGCDHCVASSGAERFVQGAADSAKWVWRGCSSIMPTTRRLFSIK